MQDTFQLILSKFTLVKLMKDINKLLKYQLLQKNLKIKTEFKDNLTSRVLINDYLRLK